MRKITLALHPKEVTAQAIKSLPNARLREVLERRFGLRGKEAETLDAIGRSFGVTRERVRQIEADGLRHLSTRTQAAGVLQPFFGSLGEHFGHHGYVFEENKLLNSIAEPRFHNHVFFLLTVGEPFSCRDEGEEWHTRWFTKEEMLKSAEAVVARTAEDLATVKKPVPAADLFKTLKARSREILGTVPGPDTLESYLAISKVIKQNPYGEFGLVSWPTIRPRGVRDRAYAVLARASKPMHFREVAWAISKSGWSAKKAHPQTVHNELIKDPRFVLVGRGLYALAERGFKPGTVSDVIVAVLKSAGGPLHRDEIVKRVLESRFVKPNTVLLNLQNKELFKRTPHGHSLA